jgi:hypothetical protein
MLCFCLAYLRIIVAHLGPTFRVRRAGNWVGVSASGIRIVTLTIRVPRHSRLYPNAAIDCPPDPL